MNTVPKVEVVETTDRRRLMVSEWGKRTGSPVFILHGTPGSRIGVAPRASVLYQLGIRLIAYDRPGYGESDRDEGRTVASAADDVRAIADHLGIERFAVVGRSGGGPHALACAALLPDLVTRAASLVSMAPRVGRHGMGARWFDGMTQGNVDAYSRAADGIARLAPALRARTLTIQNDPATLIAQLLEEVREADLQVMSDAGIRRMMKDNYRQALLETGNGWIDDALAFTKDWGFELDGIRVPVLLWHGDQDVFSPVDHSSWLAECIPGSILRTEPGKGHFDAVSVLPDILPWLKQPVPAPVLTRSAAPARG